MRALAKTLPGHCKGLDHFRTAPQFSVCRQSARATDRAVKTAVGKERDRCFWIVADRLEKSEARSVLLLQIESPTP
jgi:hypothetical protein